MDFSVDNLFRVAPLLSHPRRRASRPATLSPIKMPHAREKYYRAKRENVNYPWQVSAAPFTSSSRIHLIDSFGVGVDELSRLRG
jgi:hypothetical protein